MAGDWLKMEICLPHKPEVLAMSARTGMEPDLIVGKCFRLWSWFDQHTENGNAAGVTLVTLSYAIGNGDANVAFLEALKSVGWIIEDENGVSLPNFDRHNGETAKTRALTAKRAANYRAKSNADSNAKSNGNSVTNALPREEKRREDISTDVDIKAPRKARFDAHAYLVGVGVDSAVATDWLAIRKAKRAPATETAISGIQREAIQAGLSLHAALEVCCQRGWQGFKASWIKDPSQQPRTPAPENFSQRDYGQGGLL